MGHRRFAAHWLKLVAVAGLVGSALVGCGEDGSDGAPGSSGVVVAPVGTATALNITITSAKVASPPVVNFRVINQNGESVAGLTDTDFRFNIAKLVPGTYGSSSRWQSYLNRIQNGGVVGTQERKASGSAWGKLVANGDGSYTYTFATDITSATANVCPAPCTDLAGNRLDISFQPNLTHRVGIQLNSTALPRANGTYDFVPAGASVLRREIVRTGKCNECHGQLAAHGGGLRVETKLCVTCHNPGSWDGTSGNPQTIDFKVMVHKIHMGEHLPSVQAGGSYVVAGEDFSEVAFPQDIRNCTKCHDGTDPATPQGNNWQNVPSRAACGACHENVNFATGAGHAGGVQQDDSTCLACHSTGGMVGPVAGSHRLVELTNTTPGSEAGRAAFQDKLPAGAKRVEYQIKSVTVLSTTPMRAEVEFRILMDGAPVTFNAAAPMLSGFTGGPTFYVAYSVPQDGIATPADFNSNSGFGVPNVSLTNVWNSTGGTLSGPDGTGHYKAVLGAGVTSSVDIPVDATRVTVAMINPFVQSGVSGYPGGLTLVTPAAMKTATGHAARRVIVARDNCNNCHATLGTNPTFHSGNRNDPTLCAFCHSSQGPSTNRSWAARSTAFVHAIHGAGKRTVDFNWHGDQEYWKIGFPGILKNCETCHVAGGYDFSGSAYTATLLDSMLYTYVATGTVSDDVSVSPYVKSYVTGLPSVFPYDFGARFDFSTRVPAAATTLVTSPIATVCFACHDGAPQRAHMETYGAVIYGVRGAGATLPNTEQCLTCHGPGKVVSIADMHAK